jgi:hypothetical protein
VCVPTHEIRNFPWRLKRRLPRHSPLSSNKSVVLSKSHVPPTPPLLCVSFLPSVAAPGGPRAWDKHFPSPLLSPPSGRPGGRNTLGSGQACPTYLSGPGFPQAPRPSCEDLDPGGTLVTADMARQRRLAATISGALAAVLASVAPSRKRFLCGLWPLGGHLRERGLHAPLAAMGLDEALAICCLCLFVATGRRPIVLPSLGDLRWGCCPSPLSCNKGHLHGGPEASPRSGRRD